MKINRLEIAGFGPFKHRQYIDFDQFDTDGIFLINGKTGSGKSSILDAICFALYAQIPRYVGSSHQVRSDHCEIGDRTEVILEFTVDEEKYQVIRSPEYQRPKSRGEGTTTEKAKAGLSRWNGTNWEGIASQQREVNTRIQEIVKLSRDQFLQVILLAQNRFHEFLFADSSQRQSLLRTLFHSVRFDHYAKHAKDQADALGAEISLDQERSDTLIGVLTRHAAKLSEEHSVATAPSAAEAYEEPDFQGTPEERGQLISQAHKLVTFRIAEQTRCEEHVTQVRTAYEALRRKNELFERKRNATEQLAQLNDQRPQVQQQRELAQRLGTVAQIAPQVQRLDQQAGVVEKLQEKYAQAKAQWQQLVSAHDAEPMMAGEDTSALTAHIAQLAADMARLEEYRNLDEELPRLQMAVTTLEEDIQAAALAIETAQAEAGKLPQLIEELSALAHRQQTLSEAEPDRRQRVAELTERHKVAQQIPALEEQVTAQAHELHQAQAQRAAAARTLAEMYEKKLAASASELAQQLTPGEPCLVCGSPQHPHPAPASDEHIGDEAIKNTRDQLQRAEELVTMRSEQLQAAQQVLATAQGTVGATTLEELAASLQAAQQEVAASQSAHTQLAHTIGQRDQAVKDLERSTQNISNAQAHHQSVQAQYAVQCAELQRISAIFEEQRGTHASIKERLTHIGRRHQALEAIRDTADELRQQEQAMATIEEGVNHSMAQADLGSLSQVRELITQLPTHASLIQEIETFDQQVRDLTSVLQDPEIQAAPDSAIDLTEPAQLLADAENSRNIAVAALERARGMEQEITQYCRQLDELEKRSARRMQEYEMARGLSDLFNGTATGMRRMKLESYVLAAELAEIVQAANTRLHSMSSGRYELVVSDDHAHGRSAVGLGVGVFDLYTGRQRPTHSLSGGESFLASMALALGLAEVVTARSGGIKLNTLFIDEGFGSLDPDTLGAALAVLDDLRDGGRTIGVISHVEAMKEQIPAQLSVETTSHGWSTIRQ